MQLIYTGKTKCCHPQGIEFPFGFGVTHSFNYWSNEELAIQHIREIILSYADKIKEELGLSKDQKSLLIYVVFKNKLQNVAQIYCLKTILFMYMFLEIWRKFQPLDINVNGIAKGFLKDQFQTRYTDEIQKQMDNGKGVYEVDVDTRLTRMKPIHARWVIGLFDKLRNSEKMIANGFKAAAITEALDPEKDFGEEDPFSHLI